MNYRGPDCWRGRVVSWGMLAGAAAGAFGLLGSSGAMAQNCGPLTLHGTSKGVPPFPAGPYIVPGTLGALASGVSAASVISGAVTAANTAFLTQSTAFVSAPGNPKPDSEGGGTWVRGVGGELTLKSNTQVAGFATPNPALGLATATGTTTCASQYRQTFAGFQVGQDIANLNIASGWNLHIGTTAGYLETKGDIVGGNIQGGAFNSTTQAPFLGSYGVLTKGNFYVDGLVRYDYFQTNLDSPTANIFDQKVDAHGFTAAFSTGYNYKVPNSNWFIEPSIGLVWSRESVNPVSVASPTPNVPSTVPPPFPFSFGWLGGNFSGTTQINNIQSEIGRAGIRVGTTVGTNNLVLQPFAAVSVWHDFAGDITANYNMCPGCVNLGDFGARIGASMSTNNIGKFGQYSVGVSGQVINTGWLGFVRLDYREGPQMVGLSGTGGIRYQFTPTDTAGAVMPVKAPVYKKAQVYKAPVEAVNWTGFYVGAIGGANGGRTSMDFPGIAGADMRPAGALGGGTLGYNYQASKWVYGVEADAVWTNAFGSNQCTTLTRNSIISSGMFPPPTPLFQMTCHDGMDWIATATARLGYALAPHTLLYAKAGGAWAEATYSASCNLGPLFNSNNKNPASFCYGANPANGAVSQMSASTTLVGWTVGYGAEFALTPHWSAKGEFDWTDFGNKQVTLSDGSAVNTSQRVAQGKVGLNYKF